MPLWGNQDNAANSVKYATELARTGPLGSGNAAKAANNTTLYNNATPNAFGGEGEAIGQFAVSVPEMANTSGAEWAYVAHAGWQMRIAGSGPVANLTVSVGGTGYSNTDKIVVSGATSNASGTLSTNSTGGILTVALTGGGAGFVNVASGTLAIQNSSGGASAGSGATVTFKLGGRAGRINYETIVAMGSISSTGNTIPF